jgi:hypothetical protein
MFRNSTTYLCSVDRILWTIYRLIVRMRHRIHGLPRSCRCSALCIQYRSHIGRDGWGVAF